MNAIKDGDSAKVRILLGKPGINVNMITKGVCPLYLAVLNNRYDLIKTLVLEGHADVNGGASVWKPLAYAVISSQLVVVEFLLSQGADPHNVKDQDGLSAFDYAVMNKDSRILQALEKK